MATHVERRVHPPIPEKKSGINKKLATAILAGGIALGGGFAVYEATQNKNTSEPTPISGGIGNPTKEPTKPSLTEVVVNTPNPTSVATETPAPTENIEKTPEEMAIDTAFNQWFGIFNKNQENASGRNYNFLQTKIENMNDWEHNIAIIKSGGVSDSPLLVSWLGGQLLYPPQDSIDSLISLGIKTKGELEISNISFKNDSMGIQVTDAERGQGIQWEGKVLMSFDVRYRTNEYWPSSNDVNQEKIETVKTWLHKDEPDQLPDFSSLSTEDWGGQLIVLQKGEWKNLSSGMFVPISGLLAGLQTPSVLIDSGLCEYKAQSGCQTIYKDPPY